MIIFAMALYKLKDKIWVADPFQKHISLADIMTTRSCNQVIT